jgi:hypothetical protein
MRCCLAHSSKPIRFARIALLGLVTWASSGWTCGAIVQFDSCFGIAQPQIVSISPDPLSSNSTSVPLLVNGNDFMVGSQILWNGNPLPTTFVNSRQLQATITPQTFDSFGGSAGTSVQISVRSLRSFSTVACSAGVTSGVFLLFVN